MERRRVRELSGINDQKMLLFLLQRDFHSFVWHGNNN